MQVLGKKASQSAQRSLVFLPCSSMRMSLSEVQSPLIFWYFVSKHLQGAGANTSNSNNPPAFLVVGSRNAMSDIDASDAGELFPWIFLQERQEREAESADEEPTDVVVTAGLQQTSLHRFGQAT